MPTHVTFTIQNHLQEIEALYHSNAYYPYRPPTAHIEIGFVAGESTATLIAWIQANANRIPEWRREIDWADTTSTFHISLERPTTADREFFQNMGGGPRWTATSPAAQEMRGRARVAEIYGEDRSLWQRFFGSGEMPNSNTPGYDRFTAMESPPTNSISEEEIAQAFRGVGPSVQVESDPPIKKEALELKWVEWNREDFRQEYMAQFTPFSGMSFDDTPF